MKHLQTGTGHFSPIGGYHAERDMVLILDVARFKYPPHWVPLSLLWEAMESIDESTGRHRGYTHRTLFQLSKINLFSIFYEAVTINEFTTHMMVAFLN